VRRSRGGGAYKVEHYLHLLQPPCRGTMTPSRGDSWRHHCKCQPARRPSAPVSRQEGSTEALELFYDKLNSNSSESVKIPYGRWGKIKRCCLPSILINICHSLHTFHNLLFFPFSRLLKYCHGVSLPKLNNANLPSPHSRARSLSSTAVVQTRPQGKHAVTYFDL